MHCTKRAARAASASLAAVVLAVAFAACGDDDDDGGSTAAAPAATSEASTGATSTPAASGEPIKVGAIAAITGPVPLGDETDGAKAYFDALNERGGINGQKIDYVVFDDKTDPALTARGARDLVQNQKVVALVGDSSLVSCTVNRAFFTSQDIRSIMAGGADPGCFTQPNVSPVNTGPSGDFKITMKYAYDELGAKSVCTFYTNSPTLNATRPELNKYFESLGGKVAYSDMTLSQNSNLPALFAKAKSANCDAILTDGTPNQTAAIVKARDQQKVDKPLIFMGAQYSEEQAKALGSPKDVYSIAEMEPFTEESDVTADMKQQLGDAGVNVTGLSQFGWFAAKVFSDIAAKIEAPVTRDKVNEALLALDSLDTGGMTATPYSFGDAKAHNANKGGKIVKVEGGKWIVASPDWVVWE